MIVREKIETLVRKIVLDYLNKDKVKDSNRHILIILDEQHVHDITGLWDEIRRIANQYNTTVLYTGKWSNIPESIPFMKAIPLVEEHFTEIRAEMEKADLLFYANASFATVAKLSLTIDDQLSMWITIQMQMDGKQILLANDQLNHNGTQKVTTPYTVSKRIQSYMRTLREDKVQFVSLSTTSKWLDSYFDSYSGNRHVVLAKHIEEVANQGESLLIVPKNSLITPMCKDYARELGVVIKQKE
jgi:hypothetical protein